MRSRLVAARGGLEQRRARALVHAEATSATAVKLQGELRLVLGSLARTRKSLSDRTAECAQVPHPARSGRLLAALSTARSTALSTALSTVRLMALSTARLPALSTALQRGARAGGGAQEAARAGAALSDGSLNGSS
jgi:hypothetical protein